MSFLRRWKTGTRLALGFGCVLVLLVLAGALSVVRLNGLDSDVDHLLHLQERAAAADDWRALTLLNVTRATALARADGHAQLSEHLAPQVKATTEAISKIQERLGREIESARGKELLVKIQGERGAYLGEREKVFALLKAGDSAGARRLLDERMQPAADRYVASIEAISTFEQQLVAQTTQAMRASARQTRQAVVVLVGVCLLLGVWLAWLIARSVARPLDEAVAAADAIGRGELDREIRVDGRDEASALLASLERTRESLRGIVTRVRQGADGVATASSQIAQGNQDLSSRTEKQAAALEETASSMEELGTTVRHNADNARQANQLAQGASTVAAQGGEVVDQVVQSMRQISDSSKKIADITSVIDSIAFQTNILALNAAVEAARAGEQGRGFAVVAGEVRSLAHRSAEAAREIKALIGTSVERVEQGTVLAERAGQTMTEVVGSIRRVSDIMGEISAASSEQSSGVAQVGQAITQMDQATQQNAALVEESAAAAESLSSQSRELVEAVSIFRIAAHAAHAAPVAVAAPSVTITAAPDVPRRNGKERRGPDRARNVVRPRFDRTAAPASAPPAGLTRPAATGTDDWQSF